MTSCDSSDKNAPLTKEILTEKRADSISTLVKDSVVSTYNPVDTVVTKRLLSFVSYLDSIGFNYDTNRLKKIYGGHSKNIRYNINNHFFYASTPETSGLSTYFNNFAKDKKYEQAWHIDTEKLKKSKSIIWYFFSELKPDQFNGEKWYTDAIIEEWKFNDSSSAKAAATEIGAIAPRLYFNVGAFVCYVDNYMYIITSRSTGTMYTIKPVFKAFATRNNVTITNTDKWY